MTDIRRFLSTTGLNSVIEILPVIIVVIFSYWIIQKTRKKKALGNDYKEICRKSRLNEITKSLMLCYIVGVACMTLTPTGFWHSLWQLLTLRSFSFPDVKFHKWRLVSVWWTHFIEYSGHYLTGNTIYSEILNAVENIILFIPFGLGLPLIFKKATFPKTVFFGAAFAFLVEFIQAFIARDSNIDDFICNTLGSVVGYLIYLFVKAVFPTFVEKCTISWHDLWNEGTKNNDK